MNARAQLSAARRSLRLAMNFDHGPMKVAAYRTLDQMPFGHMAHWFLRSGDSLSWRSFVRPGMFPIDGPKARLP